jgi:hypothetical protein
MASRRCCRDNFVLGFLDHVADGFHRVCVKPLGLLIGDQSPFDDTFGYGPSGRAEQQLGYQRTGTDR